MGTLAILPIVVSADNFFTKTAEYFSLLFHCVMRQCYLKLSFVSLDLLKKYHINVRKEENSLSRIFSSCKQIRISAKFCMPYMEL